MNKILHVLDQWVGYWATLDDIVSATGLPKHSIIAHLRYGQESNQIVLKKGKYITKQNHDKISQNVVSAISKSFLTELNK